MPLGYLVTVVLAACCTALTVAPLRRPRLLALVSWRVGLLVGELPFLVLGYLLASTLLAFGQGDLDSPGGAVGLALAVLTSAGLLVVVARSLRTRSVLEGALVEAFGSEVVVARRLPWLGILLAPFGVRRREVEQLRDIGYGEAGSELTGRANLLDLYRHRSHPTGAPVFVHFHGGGFVSGRKDKESRLLLRRLAAAGWVCISANYRLLTDASYPDPLIDAKRVIAWLREHGPEYGADPSVLLLAGSSAGGHLALTAAMSPNDPRFQPGFEDVDTTVTAAISLYAYYGAVDGSDSAVRAYAVPAAPPILVIHGDLDTYVPVAAARELVADLREVSTSPVAYAQLPGAQHSFDLFGSIRLESVVNGVLAFAERVRVLAT